MSRVQGFGLGAWRSWGLWDLGFRVLVGVSVGFIIGFRIVNVGFGV